LQLYVGCSGWSYDAWLGHFYPANLELKDFLKYYSQIFDYVEIDSSDAAGSKILIRLFDVAKNKWGLLSFPLLSPWLI